MKEKDDGLLQCERCDNRQAPLLVAPDSFTRHPDGQEGVCCDCYKEGFKKTYPNEPIPEGFDAGIVKGKKEPKG